MLFQIDEAQVRCDRVVAKGRVPELCVQAQVARAAVAREEFKPIGLRDLGFECPHELDPQAVPLEARMDHQAADVAGVVDELPADRADDLSAQTRGQNVVRVVGSQEIVQGLGQRLDGVVVVEGSLALIAEVLEFKDLFGLAPLGRSDDGVHVYATFHPPLLAPVYPAP